MGRWDRFITQRCPYHGASSVTDFKTVTNQSTFQLTRA